MQKTTNNFNETREIIAGDVRILQMISDSEIITYDDNEMGRQPIHLYLHQKKKELYSQYRKNLI